MASSKFFLISGLITAVLIAILVIGGVLMYTKRTGLFVPYSYKNMDAQGTRYAPNGFEQENGKINKNLQGILAGKINQWETQQNPGSNPSDFGYYGQS